MNSTETETLADIVAEMRDAANSADAWRAGVAANVVMDFTDRVETAARRERDHAVEHATRHAEAVARDNCRDCVHNPRGGNAAAMREALKGLDEEMTFCERNVELGIGFALEGLREHCRIVRQILKSALSAPPRNCDVGTAEEQKERFMEFCDDEKGDRQHCRNCRLCNEDDCELAWAQMPYEAQEGGAS